MNWNGFLSRSLAVALLAGAVAAAPAGAARGGSAPEPRIIGGTPVAESSWPSLVAVLRTDESDPFLAQTCGGTVIAPQWVLTAAHCVDEGKTAADVAVLAGTKRLTDDSGGTKVAVAELHLHPGWDPVTTSWDVALLRLATPLGTPATALAAPALASLWAPGTLARVAGWGNISSTDDVYPLDAMEVDLPLVADADCESAYEGAFDATNQFCAGNLVDGGRDACQGDSGGPLTVTDAAGRPLLIGDTSYGDGCGLPGYPGVYGRITAFRPWIDATIGWSAAAMVDAAALEWDRAAAGEPRTVTFTSSGSAPLAVAGVALSGAGAGAFELTADGCTRTSLLPGQSCAVTIRPTRAVAADQRAELRIDTDAAGGAPLVALADLTPAAPAPPAVPVVPPTPQPPVTPPAPGGGQRVAVARATVVRLTRAPRGGGLRIATRLSGRGSVRVLLSTRVRGTRTPVRIGSANATFRAGATRTLTVTLTRRGRQLLASGRALRVTVAATTGDTTTTKTLTLARRR